MRKRIKVFTILFFFSLALDIKCNELSPAIEPEANSEKLGNKSRSTTAKNFIIVTANDYATQIGYNILKKGGTVADAAVAVQLILGLVEPQSSGIGGGTFATLYHKESNKVFSYEGREKAPKKIPRDIFLDQTGTPKRFFDAAIGGASVGVPSTLKTLHQMHNDFGKLKWEDLILPVIKFSKYELSMKFIYNVYVKLNFIMIFFINRNK